MGFLDAIFGHGIVHTARAQGHDASEVHGVYIRECRDGSHDVGIIYGANDRHIALCEYRDYSAAHDAAIALSDHYGVGVEA